MTKPRSFWPSAGTRRIGSNSYKPASGPHCLLCFVVRGPALHWLEYPSGGYRVLDLDLTCGDYEGPETLAAKKAEREAKARVEVELFMNCDMKTLRGLTPAGENILRALVQDRKDGGTGVGELTGGSGAQPRDVAQWIRDNDAHPVIWHMQDRKYRFASELHAEAAADILNRSCAEKRSACGSAGCMPTILGCIRSCARPRRVISSHS